MFNKTFYNYNYQKGISKKITSLLNGILMFTQMMRLKHYNPYGLLI